MNPLQLGRLERISWRRQLFHQRQKDGQTSREWPTYWKNLTQQFEETKREKDGKIDGESQAQVAALVCYPGCFCDVWMDYPLEMTDERRGLFLTDGFLESFRLF